jgi:tetratricopeptide (TPR) repeat protein
MSAAPKSDRNVIPRWRGYDETILLGELDPPRAREPRLWVARRQGLERREKEWRHHGSLSFAVDLIGSALVLGSSEDATKAAEQVRDDRRASGMARAVAVELLERAGEPEVHREIPVPEVPGPEDVRRIRRSTRTNSRNAIRWCELSRFYAIAGKPRKAERAMRVAVALAPTDRYVLRCAARLEIHYGAPDRAAALLRGPASQSGDPWLVAAALAAAWVAKEPSKLVRTGQKLLESGSYSAFETSELASALGTLEVGHGADRAARKLFRQALIDPTDNAVAQAEWAGRRTAGITVPEESLSQTESWEARAWVAASAGDRGKAVEEAWRWHYDQPFASRPGEFGSYQASLNADFESGVEIGKAALRANPKRFLLINNVAFCLASLDRIDEANACLREVRVSDLSATNRPIYLATRGLIAFRDGRLEDGRELYRRSISSWSDADGKALAIIMLAREELRARASQATRLVDEARHLVQRSGSDDLSAWLGQLDDVERPRFRLRPPSLPRGD